MKKEACSAWETQSARSALWSMMLQCWSTEFFLPRSCWQWSYPVIHCQGQHIGKPEGTLWAMAEQISWRFKDNISTFGLASECSAQILWGPGSNKLARNWRRAVENRTAIPPWRQLPPGCCHFLPCANASPMLPDIYMFTRNAGNADFYGKCPT